jgi:hypothetical protein
MGSETPVNPLLIGYGQYPPMPAILYPDVFGGLMSRAVLRLETWEPGSILNGSGVAAADSETVATIVDLSAGGYNATQSSDPNRAVWSTGEINGHGALVFDEVNDGYITECDLTGSYTLYGVTQRPSISGGTRAVNSRDQNRLVAPTRNNNAVFLGGFVVDDMQPYTGWQIWVLRNTAGVASSFRIGGADITEVPSRTGDWGRVSLAEPGVFLEPWGGMIASVGAFNFALSDLEVAELEEYLSEKTGISV